MKVIFVIVFPILTLLLYSCSSNKAEKQNIETLPPLSVPNKFRLKLTEEQQDAFNDLDKLQLSSDSRSRLYSTFPNIEQPFYPADSTFTISQKQFSAAMKIFVSRYWKALPKEEQLRLSESSVKAQKEYKVYHCWNNSSEPNYENGLPLSGTWILPNVLSCRDIVLMW